MNNHSGLSNVERQEKLALFLQKHQRVSVAQICDEFSISPATARRDLETLERGGKIRRVHGGALAIKSAPPEPPFSLRTVVQAEEKLRIGRAAAALIQEGETVFLGGGTTVLEVAHSLREHRNLTVFTNSLLVMNALADVPGIMLVSLGGILRPSELSFLGHITEQALAEIRVDKVVMGIRAIDIEAGLTNDYLLETQTDRAIFEVGEKVILVADYTKCERISTAFVAPITAIDTFVTDSQAPPDFLSALMDRGIHVLTV